MLNIGGGEMLVIFLAALILVGPAKLPELARQLGSIMQQVRKMTSGLQAEMRAAMDEPPRRPTPEAGGDEAHVAATSSAQGVDAPATPMESSGTGSGVHVVDEVA